MIRTLSNRGYKLGVGNSEDRQKTETLATETRRINQNSLSSKLKHMLYKSPKNITTLDQVIDIDKEIENFKQDKVSYINPEILYQQNTHLNKSRLLLHYRETKNRCVGDEVVSINLINPETQIKLEADQFDMTHMGLIIIGIKGLTRKDIGAKVFLALIDNRFNSREAIIGAIEVDMNNNGGLFYCSPNYALTTKDFAKHIKVKIITRGYENLIEGKNLLICTSFFGKLTQGSQIRFKFDIKDTIEAITNKGIKLLPPYKIEALENAGQEWKLHKIIRSEDRNMVTPKESFYYTDCQGRLSVRFTDYTEASSSLPNPTEESDSE